MLKPRIAPWTNCTWGTRGQFHKPIYALCQAFTLCAKLLRLKKASQKLGAERKWVYEIHPRLSYFWLSEKRQGLIFLINVTKETLGIKIYYYRAFTEHFSIHFVSLRQRLFFTKTLPTFVTFFVMDSQNNKKWNSSIFTSSTVTPGLCKILLASNLGKTVGKIFIIIKLLSKYCNLGIWRHPCRWW